MSDANTLRNITNIMASKEDLIYKALEVSVARQHHLIKSAAFGTTEKVEATNSMMIAATIA